MKKKTAIILFWLFNALNLTDALSTVAAITKFSFVKELNPIADYFLQISPVLFIALKLLVGGVCSYILFKYSNRSSAKYALIILNVMYFLVIFWHSCMWYYLAQF